MTPKIYRHPFINGAGEIPEDKIESIKRIRAWLNTQPHLPDLTDDHLHMFLHSNYDNVEAAQNTIESYYTIRAGALDIFANRSPLDSNVQSAWDTVYMAPLPKPTPEGHKVYIYKLADTDPSKFNYADIIKAMIMYSDIRCSEDGITPGYIIVCDSKGFSMSHLTKISISILRIFMKYIQEGKPVRLKGLHVIHSAAIVDKFVTLAKPFMKSELIKMLHIHTGSDLTKFCNAVPLDILPEDYGGKAESLSVLHERNRKMMVDKYVDWIKEDETYVQDTAKKLNLKKKQNGTCNGTTTSLRNLSID